MAETMLCNNIRQHKAVVNRHSSRHVPQDIVITLIFERSETHKNFKASAHKTEGKSQTSSNVQRND